MHLHCELQPSVHCYRATTSLQLYLNLQNGRDRIISLAGSVTEQDPGLPVVGKTAAQACPMGCMLPGGACDQAVHVTRQCM